MKLSERGKRLIYQFEGLHRKVGPDLYVAYKCPAGVDTIYAGCTSGVKPGMTVTTEQGEAMFEREIASFENAVARLVTVDITQNQRDALISFAYNCGEGALGKSTLLKRVNAGDHEGAAREFSKWTKGGGRVLPGLVRRRAAEASLYLEPMDHSEPDMPQRVQAKEDKPPPSVDATAGAVAGGTTAGVTLPHVPAPPDLTPYTAWQSFAETLIGIGSWAFGAPWKVAIVGAVVGVVGWGLPYLSRRVQT